MPYRKSAPYDGLNGILEWKEEIGRKKDQIGSARRHKHNPWLTESCTYGQGTDKSFSLFQYFTSIMKLLLHPHRGENRSEKWAQNEWKKDKLQAWGQFTHIPHEVFLLFPIHQGSPGYGCMVVALARRSKLQREENNRKTMVVLWRRWWEGISL